MDIKTLQALMGSGSGDQTNTIWNPAIPPGGGGRVSGMGGISGGLNALPDGPEYGPPFVDPYGGSAEAWAAANAPDLLRQLSVSGPGQARAQMAINAAYRGWLAKAESDDAYKKRQGRQAGIKGQGVGEVIGR